MKTTKNYGLIKPEPAEYYDVEQFNQNMDVIDEKIKEIDKSNVPNVSTNNQAPTYTVSTTLTNLVSGEKLYTAFGKIAKAIKELIAHIANRTNPHGVTAGQIGALTRGDVIDDLSSTSRNLPLSANQGNLLAKVQKALITAHGTDVSLAVTSTTSTNDASGKTRVPLNAVPHNVYGYKKNGGSYNFHISDEMDVNAWDKEVTKEGGIVCPSSGFVLVSGSAYLHGTTGMERTKKCFILHEYGAKNERKIKEESFQAIRDMGAPGGISAGATIIPVQDGDILYLGVYSSVDAICDTTNAATYLSAIYLD